MGADRTNPSARFPAWLAPILVLAALATAPCANAQSPTKITLAIPVVSVSASYAFIADAMGYWKQRGLDVTVTVISGVQASQALLAGDVEFAHSSGDNIITLVAHGQHAIAIGNMHNALYYELVLSKKAIARSGLTLSSPLPARAAAIKGLVIANGGTNSIQDDFLTHIAQRGGLDPARDLTRTNLEPAALIAALAQGRIDGFIANPPYSSVPEEEGTGTVWISGARHDMPELDPFENTIMTARTDYCPQNPTICIDFLAGMRQAMALEISNRAKALEIIKPEFKTMDAKILGAAFDQQRGILETDLKMNEAAFANTQKFALQSGMITPAQEFTKFEGKVYTNAYLQ